MENNHLQAINIALKGNWKEAIILNEEILKQNKDDLDTLCRLAYAYAQNGETQKAKKIYRKVLALDQYNTVALKNLNKLNSLKGSLKNKINSRYGKLTPELFIEEPGKTKIVQLKNIAPSSIISKLNIGECVLLYPKKHSIEVRTEDKTYIGALPDDIAFRLLRFISAGNKYAVCIKNFQKNSLSIFVREIMRGKKFKKQPSFISTSVRDYTASMTKEMKKIVETSDNNASETNQTEEE